MVMPIFVTNSGKGNAYCTFPAARRLQPMLTDGNADNTAFCTATELLTVNKSLSAAFNVVNVAPWAPYSSRIDPMLTDFWFYHVLRWCYFWSCWRCPLPVSFTYKSICEINPKAMSKVYLGCCLFLYQEKLGLWHQLSEKKAHTQTSVRVRHALLALLVSSLGFFLLANVLFSHKYGADAAGGNAVGTAAFQRTSIC